MATYTGIKKIKIGDNVFTLAIPTKVSELTNDSGFITADTNTTYTLSGALSSHKFTSTLTAGGSGSGTSTSDFTLAAGTGITITDDTSNRKMTIACSITNTDTKLKLTSTTTSASYKIALGPSSITSGTAYEGYYSGDFYYNPSTHVLSTTKMTFTPATTGFTIAGGNTTSKTLTVSETYTLGAACAKAVDTSISAASSSANLPTSAAVASFVEGKGYVAGASKVQIVRW